MFEGMPNHHQQLESLQMFFCLEVYSDDSLKSRARLKWVWQKIPKMRDLSESISVRENHMWLLKTVQCAT